MSSTVIANLQVVFLNILLQYSLAVQFNGKKCYIISKFPDRHIYRADILGLIF